MVAPGVFPPPNSLRLVLLADNDAEARWSCRDYLSRRGVKVEEAADAPEALAKAVSQRPDVVVAETELRGFSGYDLCDLLRRDPATLNTPVILVTTTTLEVVRERARNAGADIVLIKPYMPDALFAEMRRLISRSRELRTRGGELRGRVAAQLARSQALQARIASHQSRALSKIFDRHDTSTPPLRPPPLRCPACDHALVYTKSHCGGVSERYPEQWDYYTCPSCSGNFQ